MLRKTHIAAGIASALIITHPDTIPGIIAATTGGALGGWIVDVDCKKTDVDYERVVDSLLEILLIGALIVLDFIVGDGMCKYVMTHGLEVWIALIVFVFLTLLGYQTKHRTFTHSFLAMGLFGTSIYFFCRPMTIPFVIGYASHLVLDLFNKKGMQLFYPLEKKFCLEKWYSDQKANAILMFTFIAIDFIVGAGLIAFSILKLGDQSQIIQKIQSVRLIGLNSLQVYLIFINIISFIEAHREWKIYKDYDSDYDEEEPKLVRYIRASKLSFYMFIGGPIGMLLSLIIHKQYPAGYNANWWSICYASILVWFVIYSHICNPFGFTVGEIKWQPVKHIRMLGYLLGINIINAALFFIVRKMDIGERNVLHTILWIIGALGGTIGPYPVVITTHQENDNMYTYALFGFPIMLAAQIIFIIYMMAVGVL